MTQPKLTLPNIAGYLNPAELTKIFVQAHIGAFGIALLIGLLSKVSASVALMFPDPVVAFLVAQIIGLLIGVLRKLPDYDANALPNILGLLGVSTTTPTTVVPAPVVPAPAPPAVTA